MMESGQPSSPDLFLNVPFSKKWGCHKDTILRLYIDEDRRLEDVVDIMKRIYRFDANARQYKYHLKKWNISKSISSYVKDQAIRTLGKRLHDGTSVGSIRYKGVEINKQKLRRFIKDDARLSVDLKMSGFVFGRWSPLEHSMKPNLDHPSPGASDFSTPSDFSVFSPPVIRDHPRPEANAASPTNAPTPTAQAISVKTRIDNSKLLLQGDIRSFLKGMPFSDRVAATTWLHQFWIFAFKTSKYWGKGPQRWTADLLRMTELLERHSLPGTPASWELTGEDRRPSDRSRYQCIVPDTDHQQYKSPEPSPLCRWCIHLYKINREGMWQGTGFDVYDCYDWPRWAKAPCTVMERLNSALEDNSFSDINNHDLPLSTSVIVESAKASPDAMAVEAIGFAIMARNKELVHDLLQAANLRDLDLSAIHPYHLAASYLDGSSTCCGIFHELLNLPKRNVFIRLYVNNLGHTVLDSLMLTILKGHTSCTPFMADERLMNMEQFPGEDIDVCGRWDADASCLRVLNTLGSPRIPFSWKHMFCHTSIQAVCHSVTYLFSFFQTPDINTPSGLFTKSCFACGNKLVPGPLHTLVLTASQLAQRGFQGENLFGMVACLVFLLTKGANPAFRAEISIGLLLGVDDQLECRHDPLDPLELGEKVSSAARNFWPEETKLGWDCFMAVLRFAQREMARIRGRLLLDENAHSETPFIYGNLPLGLRILF
ncbi:hypothetical protein F5B22DRAFT_108079 [Xylaria bambusicola]|uniref:uncharacterized protein n=1 Tax=Xylaria bambusicola TaxID=326684 RepID=UPI002008103C|nr:uncharacterized protein F5B22DRAFT_108079 [Xylaria bambusicola]KAI0517505.1 hypothetical protein F5B22DRAFT_108079 [Xylaria bambusicola]